MHRRTGSGADETMKPNQKLTNALRGRTLAAFEGSNGVCALHFEDKSVLRIKGMPANSGALPQRVKLSGAFEQGDRLELHFQDGSTIHYALTDPGNAVSVRDATGKVLYLG